MAHAKLCLLGKKVLKWRSFEKERHIFTDFSQFLINREKTHTQKKSFTTYLTNFAKTIRSYRIWFFFSTTTGFDFHSRRLEAINEQQNAEQN